MKTRKEVLKWLKDNGYYELVKRKMPVPVERYQFEDCALRDFFVGAFDWEYTSEGKEFWKKVNRDYQEWFGPLPDDDDDIVKRRRRRAGICYDEY